MKIVLLILCMVRFAFSSNLDSLLEKSVETRRSAQRVQGFIFSHGKVSTIDVNKIELQPRLPIHLTPPDSLFGHHAVSTPAEVASLNERITKIEESVDKITKIMENTHAQAELNTEHLNFIVKIMELIGGIIGGLVALLGGIATIIKLLKGK